MMKLLIALAPALLLGACTTQQATDATSPSAPAKPGAAQPAAPKPAVVQPQSAAQQPDEQKVRGGGAPAEVERARFKLDSLMFH